MTRILHVRGASFTDACFTLDPNFLGEEICWNVSAIQRAADVGAFGPPETVLMEWLPEMDARSAANIDWNKVARFAADKEILAKPTLAVLLRLRSGPLYRIPIDGNHRICARRRAGFGGFQAYVVPEDRERAYRIRFDIEERET